MLIVAGLIVLACLLASGVLSALHLALIDVSRAGLEELAEQRASPGTRRRIDRILQDLGGHARSVAMVRVVFNLLAVTALVWWVAAIEARVTDALEPGAALTQIEITWRHGVIAVSVGAALMWLLSVIIPQAWARHAGERLVLRFARLARVADVLLRPLAPLEHAIDAGVRKLSGKKEEDKHAELQAELLNVVTEGERGGQLDEDQALMIEAIVRLRETTVGQIMTPRREVEALELTANLGAVTAFVRKARHSRIPVYKPGGSLDDVVGFFYVKDLLKWLAGGDTSASATGSGPAAAATTGSGAPSSRGFDLRAILRPALFVPESKTVRGLAQEFVDKRVHIAMVADEYGGTAGLVTLEDVIEEVFGEIQDEYEKAEDEPPRIELKDGEYLADIDARAYVEDVNEALEDMGVKIPEADDYDTLGGFVTTHMGRIPESNESFELGPAVVTVLEATPMRVVRVRVALRPEEREARERRENNGAESETDGAASGSTPATRADAGGPK